MILAKTKELLLRAQKNEITEHFIYAKLALREKSKDNRKILESISKDELRHYLVWKGYTKEEVKPSKIKIWFYYLVSMLFGLTFGVKLMEKGEGKAEKAYAKISKEVPVAEKIAKEEDEHEHKLLSMINEEKLNYVGSIVLGLNDALVELTGTLAGLSFALQNSKLTALAGGITGIAASLSMAASGYLSSKEEGKENPLKSSVYTGIAYIFTVILLILPFILFSNIFYSLAATITVAILIILIFTFYTSVAKDLSFRKRFFEMAAISIGVAMLSFGIGIIVRNFIGIDV